MTIARALLRIQNLPLFTAVVSAGKPHAHYRSYELGLTTGRPGETASAELFEFRGIYHIGDTTEGAPFLCHQLFRDVAVFLTANKCEAHEVSKLFREAVDSFELNYPVKAAS